MDGCKKSYFWKKDCLGSNMHECNTCQKIVCKTHGDNCCDPNPNIQKVEIRRSKRIPVVNRRYEQV